MITTLMAMLFIWPAKSFPRADVHRFRGKTVFQCFHSTAANTTAFKYSVHRLTSQKIMYLAFVDPPHLLDGTFPPPVPSQGILNEPIIRHSCRHAEAPRTFCAISHRISACGQRTHLYFQLVIRPPEWGHDDSPPIRHRCGTQYRGLRKL